MKIFSLPCKPKLSQCLHQQAVPKPSRKTLIPRTAAHRDSRSSDMMPPQILSTVLERRALMQGLVASLGAFTTVHPALAIDIANDKYNVLPSGLKILDVKIGSGDSPQPGDTVVVHWAGYTKGYQGKKIDNTSLRDEPYTFVLGKHEAIPAFEEAVSSMKAGGIRRVEIPGELPELSYPRDRSQRFTNELIPTAEGKIYRYRFGPQPSELGGQRSLDFVLDNPTLYDLNRTLLMDIKLLRVRK